jgi:VanZ family protein
MARFSLSTRHYRGLALLWAAVILLACALPSTGVPRVSVFGADKVVHAGLFFGWGVLLMRALRPLSLERPRMELGRRAAGLFVGGTVFAGLTEAMQHVLPVHRTADVYDFAADVLGLALAIGLYCAWRYRQLRAVRPESPRREAQSVNREA